MTIGLVVIAIFIFCAGVVSLMFSYAIFKVEESYYATVPLITGVVLLSLTYWLTGVIVNEY